MESLNNNPFTISHNAIPQNPSEETHQALGIKIVGGASTSDAIDDFGSLHDRQVESLPPVHEVQAVNTPFFKKEDFGNDFKWGVATAAYQIEGAWNVDGKGPSVWDHMTHTKPRKVKKKENGDVACDFYNRFHDDIPLVKEMNFQVFRFSIAWTRIFPTGTGTPNQKGVDFYHRVIDRCLELGIEPWITIYHWDLPQALEDKGGWANRDGCSLNLITDSFVN